MKLLVITTIALLSSTVASTPLAAVTQAPDSANDAGVNLCWYITQMEVEGPYDSKVCLYKRSELEHGHGMEQRKVLRAMMKGRPPL
ncbi:hypothetical protein FPQ18DRAFT_327861 [Pyronema domesticum]|nr:hypothetical protein FPQ18DRAFT_327861 [Pyronema domesticum]